MCAHSKYRRFCTISPSCMREICTRACMSVCALCARGRVYITLRQTEAAAATAGKFSACLCCSRCATSSSSSLLMYTRARVSARHPAASFGVPGAAATADSYTSLSHTRNGERTTRTPSLSLATAAAAASGRCAVRPVVAGQAVRARREARWRRRRGTRGRQGNGQGMDDALVLADPKAIVMYALIPYTHGMFYAEMYNVSFICMYIHIY